MKGSNRLFQFAIEAKSHHPTFIHGLLGLSHQWKLRDSVVGQGAKRCLPPSPFSLLSVRFFRGRQRCSLD